MKKIDGREVMNSIASLLHKKFGRGDGDRRALTYCAPFYKEEDDIWVLELRKRGSDNTAQVRIEKELSDPVFETLVGEVNNFLNDSYE